MHLSATVLKVLTATATLAATGGAGALVVLNDPKPAAAPLHPPVAGKPAALAPLPPSCTNAGDVPPGTLSEAQKQELMQLRQTPKAQRRALLATFPAEDRLQILAYQAAHRQPKAAASTTRAACNQTSQASAISASTVEGIETGTPVISYVS